MQHRTATNVMRFVRDRILLRHGTPNSIHSDHARELVGRVMTDLAATFNYVNTSTGGYCPTGNSVIESFWQYFNVCLRDLSDAEYENIEEHVQNIAWVWNTTTRSSIGARPFEVMTGTPPVTISDSLVLPPPVNDTLNMYNIRHASAAYAQHAREHGDFMRQLRAAVLNKHGCVLKRLKIGDLVKIYVPPSHGEAVRRHHKVKHICQWRGPLRIVKRLSETTFELASYFNPNKRFRRHLTNVRRWLGPVPANATSSDNSIVPLISDVKTGEIAFAIDSTTSTVMYLVRVTSADETAVNVHAWGTTSKNHLTGKYKPVMILNSTDQPTTRPRKNQQCRPWTWKILVSTVNDLLVLKTAGL